MTPISADGAAAPHSVLTFNRHDRRAFIGGSDARIIMGNDQDELMRLWQEKRGEIPPQDLSRNLIVQLGIATQELNRSWYQSATGHAITDIQKRVRHPVHAWMAATLDGMVAPTGAVFEAKFMCPGPLAKRRRPRNTWRSCSTTCGWSRRAWPCFRSSPAAANESRSPCMPTRSTNTCC